MLILKKEEQERKNKLKISDTKLPIDVQRILTQFKVLEVDDLSTMDCKEICKHPKFGIIRAIHLYQFMKENNIKNPTLHPILHFDVLQRDTRSSKVKKQT